VSLSFPNSFRRHYIIVYAIAALGAVFALLLMLPYLISLDRVQQAAAAKISAMTGQDVTFSGTTRRFSLPLPYFTLRNVQISGSKNGPALLRAPRIEAEITLASLLGGEIEISSLNIINPKISLNTDAQDQSNWKSSSSILTLFDPRETASSALRASSFRVGNIRIVNGTILYTHDKLGTRTQLDDVNLTLFWPNFGKRLALRGTLAYNSQILQFSSALQNPAALFQRNISPFDLSIGTSALNINLSGEIFAAQELKIEALLKLTSPSLRELAHLAVPNAVSIPDLGKITAASKLRLHDQDIVLDDAHLQIGSSRADGSLAFRSTGQRPFMQGTLDFDTVDLRPFLETQLKGLITNQGWSNTAIKGDNLSALDMDLRLSAKTLQLAKTTIGDAALSILTRENRVELSLGDGKIYGGQMSGRFVAESRNGGGVKAYGTLGLTDMSVGDALRELFRVVRINGLVNLSLNLSGEGTSAQSIFSSLQGEARLRLNDGGLAGIDMAALLARAREKHLDAFLEVQRGNTEIENADMRFIIKDSIAVTDDARVRGPGYRLSLNGKALLAKQALDMHGKISPPPDAAQQVSDLPFVLKGSWLHPSIMPDSEAPSHSAPLSPSQ
jgi:AsmA protein